MTDNRDFYRYQVTFEFDVWGDRDPTEWDWDQIMDDAVGEDPDRSIPGSAKIVLVDGCPESRCPACGEPMDYCQGHGEIGDPAGYLILRRHDDGDHRDCADGASCDA